jgi:hypothetical protein
MIVPMLHRVEVTYVGGGEAMGLPVPAARVFAVAVRAELPRRVGAAYDFGCGAARCWLDAEGPAGAPLKLPPLREPDLDDLISRWDHARASLDRDSVHEAAVAAARAGGLPGKVDLRGAWAALRAMPRRVVDLSRPAEHAPFASPLPARPVLAGVTHVRLDAALTAVSLIWLADPRTSLARATLVGGYTSRLVQRLRVRDALVYHVEVDPDDDRADLRVTPADVAAVLAAVGEEVAALTRNGPTGDERQAFQARERARGSATRETVAGRTWLEGRRLLAPELPGEGAGDLAPSIVITGPAPGVFADRTWDPSAVWGPR